MLFGPLKPLLGILDRFIVCPVASALAGRIDYASDMTTGTEDKARRATGKLRDSPRRPPRHNVVLLRAYSIDILLYLVEVYGNTFQHHFVRFDQIILQVGVAHVER